MRTDRVLNEEESEMLFLTGQNKHDQKSDSEVCEIFAEPKRLTPRILITEAELLELTEHVKMSEFFKASKVNDMEISLIRELIR